MSYGCYNRPPLLDFNIIKASWPDDKPLHIQNRMSKTCEYTKHDRYSDQECMGCCHRINNQEVSNHDSSE